MQSDREIVISIDPDWAPRTVVEDTLELLNRYEVRATFFMTNHLDLDLSSHEIAIHPHFETFDYESHLRARLNEFPEAIGTRSHALFDTYRLQPIYERLGIRYQSNVVVHRQPHLRPYRISRSVVELPIFWMDNIHMMMEGESASFDIRDLKLEEPGLKVFCFHPIHVFLNTGSMSTYNSAKEFYSDPTMLLKYRNSSNGGVRSLFSDLLDYLSANDLGTRPLSEIAGWLL